MTKITLTDIAEATGFSVNTVSLVLRNRQGISEETRNVVLATAEELGYLKSGNIKIENIAVVSTKQNMNDTYFYTTVLSSIENELRLSNYNLLLFNDFEKNSFTYIKNIIGSSDIKGAIILGDIADFVITSLIDLKIPVVGIGFFSRVLQIPTIIEDNATGIFKIIDHFVNNKITKIGFVGSIDFPISFSERFINYAGTLNYFGIQFNKDYCFFDCIKKQEVIENLFIKELESKTKLPDAFICASDRIGIAVSNILQKKGIKIPDDISLFGFDNNDISRYSTPNLSTVDTFAVMQGKATVDLLIEIISNKDYSPIRKITPIEIVLRESSIN